MIISEYKYKVVIYTKYGMGVHISTYWKHHYSSDRIVNKDRSVFFDSTTEIKRRVC